jgi:cysteine-rich repeat protein
MRSFRIGGLAAVIALTVAGCIDDTRVSCADGLSCPDGTACDDAHRRCVDPTQVSACSGIAQHATCAWNTGSGECFDGVCLLPGCGNGIVEPELGEQCDDGNHVSGDGCSADCRSNETCGNGVVDAIKGELCDDHNLRSHDGCDSACQLETSAWTAEGIGVPDGENGHGAYDEAFQQFVHYAHGLTWTYSAGVWKLAAQTGPPAEPAWYWLVYDSDRNVVVLLGASTSPPGVKPIDLVWEWNGTQWLERPIAATAETTSGIATYDRANHRTVVYGGDRMFALDSATGIWTSIDPMPTVGGCSNLQTEGGQAMLYDPLTQHVVLVLGGYQPASTPTTTPGAVPPNTWVLDNTTWITPCSTLGLQGFLAPGTLVADAGIGLLMLGASTTTDQAAGPSTVSLSAGVYQWNAGSGAGTWVYSVVSNLPNTSASIEAAGLGVGAIAFGGLGDDDVYNLISTQWSLATNTQPHPRSTEIAAFDDAHQQLVLFQGDDVDHPGETWLWNGTWRQLVTTSGPTLVGGAVISYDPIRSLIVLLDLDDKTWLFDSGAATWTQLGTTGVPSVVAIVFDPAHRQLVAIGQAGLYSLSSDGGATASWTLIGPVPPLASSAITLAFDAREDQIIAVGGAGENAYSFDGAAWLPVLVPGDLAYHVLADARRGSLDFTSPTALWERTGQAWNELDSAPVAISIDSASYSDPDGRLIVMGSLGARMLLTRQLASSLPTETCQPDVDADLDGLAGCADPDCWWSCNAACPPYATCP